MLCVYDGHHTSKTRASCKDIFAPSFLYVVIVSNRKISPHASRKSQSPPQ